jgi:hypothetical protein
MQLNNFDDMFDHHAQRASQTTQASNTMATINAMFGLGINFRFEQRQSHAIIYQNPKDSRSSNTEQHVQSSSMA